MIASDDIVGLEIAPANKAEASDIAVLTDMAGHGLPAHFWTRSDDRAAGQSLLEIGRERLRRDEADFSWRNAWIARIDGAIAGMMLGYRQPDDLAAGDLPDVPDLVRPLLELEAEASGSWYLNVLSVYPEHRGRGLGRALLEHAFSVARDTGATEISLIVEDDNRGARRLYAAMGFEERASRPFLPFPGGPESREWLLMVREIES